MANNWFSYTCNFVIISPNLSNLRLGKQTTHNRVAQLAHVFSHTSGRGCNFIYHSSIRLVSSPLSPLGIRSVQRPCGNTQIRALLTAQTPIWPLYSNSRVAQIVGDTSPSQVNSNFSRSLTS